MIKLLLAPLGLLMIGQVHAADSELRGQWEVRMPANPNYRATVLIDADGRVTADSPNDQGRPAKFFGYIKSAGADGKVTIIFTDRKQVPQTHCAIQSSELLHCYSIRDDKSVSAGYALVKLGPGPKSLMPAAQ